MPSTYLLVLILIALCHAGIAVWVFSRKPADAEHQSCSLFEIGVTLWILGDALILATRSFVFENLSLGGGITMLIGLVSLTHTLPTENSSRPRLWYTILPLIGVYLALPFRVFIRGMAFASNGALMTDLSVGLPVFICIVGGYGTISAVRFWRSYRESSGLHRLQSQYLFFVAFTLIGALFVFDIALPTQHLFRLVALGPIASLPITIATAYAIHRHRLMDIQIVIQRSVVYSIMVGIAAVLFFSLLIGFELVLNRRRPDGPALAAAGSALALTVAVFEPFERRLRALTDRLFFKRRYDSSHVVQKLSETLNATLVLEQLIPRVLRKLKHLFRTRIACVYLMRRGAIARYGANACDDPSYRRLMRVFHVRPHILVRSDIPYILADRHLATDLRSLLEEIRQEPSLTNVELGVPIFNEHVLAGVLLLGPKLSGDPYTTEDLELLQTFAHQAAVAIARAKLYSKVRSYSRRLRQKVEERTQRLARLQEDQVRMIGDITHGLQTPLTILKAQIETARRRPHTPVEWDLYESLTDRMSRLLYDLLKLIRLETGNEDFRRSRVDLSKLLGEMGKNFDVLMRQQRISFKTDIAPGVTIRGREDAIEDLVTNLVSNAVKYMTPSGPRRIKVGLHGATLTVSDTGVGIPQQDVPHIFKRFYRARNHTGDGTGLGLAICQTIAEKHRATINVESEEGKGTTFTIVFPLARRKQHQWQP
jgi:signal transduction histidine kinase